MEMRMAKEQDYLQLAEMKWMHCEEDDLDYNEKNLVGINKDLFIKQFVEFLKDDKEYRIFVACEKDIVVSAMFVYMVPKIPKPNSSAKYIAYLTNVHTLKEYRNKGIGTELLTYIKDCLLKESCQLIFVWPSEKSANWYSKNGFCQENEIFECVL